MEKKVSRARLFEGSCDVFSELSCFTKEKCILVTLV